MTDFTILKLVGEAVGIMCKVNSSYEQFVVIENGRKTLYLRILKVLYGCVKSALLWYELFTNTLKGMGFELNPYDPWVVKKALNSKQCTIAWYVDDNTISHKDEDVVISIIGKIEECFGKMTVTRGNNHVFLGMDIAFNEDGTVTIKMKDYEREIIADFGDDVSRLSATPATKKLFGIDETLGELTTKGKEIFHSVVAKLLYISKRGCPDVQLAVAFSCVRVSWGTEQDWKKLKRALQYLHGGLKEHLVIGADNLTVLNTWVDAAYGVHQDMKSHTGGGISLGQGAVMCKSSKQKLSTKSSTEAELVGASDHVPSTIWLKMFLEGQGYEIKENHFGQDNESAMKMEMNGRSSGGQKSRHIDIRFLIINDWVKTEGVSIVYCPTEEMLADFFTKPLQESLFHKFKEVVMGKKYISILSKKVPSIPSEERVGSPTSVVVNGKPLGTKGQTREVTGKRVETYYAAIVRKNIPIEGR